MGGPYDGPKGTYVNHLGMRLANGVVWRGPHPAIIERDRRERDEHRYKMIKLEVDLLAVAIKRNSPRCSIERFSYCLDHVNETVKDLGLN